MLAKITLLLAIAVLSIQAAIEKEHLPIEKVPNLWQLPPRGQNTHTRSFHHFDEETGQYAKLKYHMETTGEVFSYIQDGIGIERMYCTINNREVIVWFGTDSQARSFYNELRTSEVVSSIPPYMCGKSTVLLRLRNVSMFGPRMVRIVGTHVQSFFELVKTLNMQFDTNMMSHNGGKKPEQVPLAKQDDHHWKQLADSAQELPREFFEDPDMYRRREFEKASNVVQTQIQSAHTASIQSDQALVDDMSKLSENKREKIIAKLSQEADAETDSGLAHHRIVQALDTWGKEEKCKWGVCVTTGIWINYLLDTAPKYWTVPMSMPDAIISGIKMVFPAIKSMELTSQIDIMPTFHFLIKYDNWSLRNAELWLDVEWYYQAKFAIAFNGAINKQVSIPLWSMKNLPGAIFPVGPIVFGLCPVVALSLRPKVVVSGAFSKLRYKKTTGYFKFGFAYSQSSGVQKVSAKSGPTDVHPQFDPVFHQCSGFGVLARHTDVNNALGCGTRCIANANCKSYRILNNVCELSTNPCTSVSWVRDGAQGYYKRLAIPGEYFNGDVTVYIEIPVVLTLQLNAWITAVSDPCTTSGVSVGGPWLTFAVGPYFDIRSKQNADKTRQTDTEIGLIIEMTVGVTLMIKFKILVISLTLWSMEIASVCLFTITIPLSRQREIFDANGQLTSTTKLTISGTSWITVDGPVLTSPFVGAPKALEHSMQALGGKAPDALAPQPILSKPNVTKPAPTPAPVDPKLEFVQGYTASTQFTGMCDSDVFVYRTRVQYVSKGSFVISYFIDHGEKTCSLQGLYASKSLKGDHLVLEHTPDKVFDRDSCWMQDIPRTLKIKKSINQGITLYNRWGYCAVMALRKSSSFTVMKVNQSLITEQTVNNIHSRLAVRSNGDVDLMDIDTNIILWSAGTGQAVSKDGHRLVATLTFRPDGNLVLEKYYEGSESDKTVKVIGGAPNAKYLEIKDCDVVMYGETMGAPNIDKPLWSMTNRDNCDDLQIEGGSPKWHHGGNVLYTGEILNENAGLYSSECVFQHDYGRAHIISWDTLETTWTTAADESAITRNTAAVTLLWNGNVALFDKAGHIVWQTNTAGSYASFLRLEGCRLVLYRTDPTGPNQALWTLDGNMKKASFVEPIPELPAPKHHSTLRRPHMELGDFLLPGQSIKSRNAILVHQPDGNVVLYLRNTSSSAGVRPVWSTNTAGKCTSAFAFTHDGNLGLYACPGTVKGNPQLWGTGALSQRPQFVALNDDCTLQLYAQAFKGTFNPASSIKSLYETKCKDTMAGITYTKMYTHIVQGNKLERGQTVYADHTALLHQPDGNVVFFAYRPATKIIWQTNTAGKCTSSLLVNNGNIILRGCENKNVVWQAITGSDAKSSGINITLGLKYIFLEDIQGKAVWRSDAAAIPALPSILKNIVIPAPAEADDNEKTQGDDDSAVAIALKQMNEMQQNNNDNSAVAAASESNNHNIGSMVIAGAVCGVVIVGLVAFVVIRRQQKNTKEESESGLI